MPPARKNPSKSSLAGSAGEQVRAIIEAAEATAAEIRAAAERDAERIRSEARRDAEALVEKLRSAIDRLAQELELRPGGGAPPSPAVAAAREVELPPAPPGTPAPVAEADDEDPDIALAEDAAVGLDETAGEGDDTDSARLVALNMVLDGASRDEVDRHLRENFEVGNRDGLLDEVFASLGR